MGLPVLLKIKLVRKHVRSSDVSLYSEPFFFFKICSVCILITRPVVMREGREGRKILGESPV